MSRDGSARIMFTDSGAIVRRAGEIHSTSKTMTAVLGRALTAASLMGTLLKDKDNSLTLRIAGDGPAGQIVCVSDYAGNVRGYAENPSAELPPNALGKLDVGGAVGRGSLYVIKDLGMNEPYVGVSELVSGEIGDDITAYFAASEQTPSVCALGVRVDNNCKCTYSGGFLLQLLPGADDEVLTILEENISRISSVSKMLADGKGAREIFDIVFDKIGYDIFDEFDTEYRCTCRREKYLTAMAGLCSDDIDSLAKEGDTVETGCMFCGQKYTFTIDEILKARKS